MCFCQSVCEAAGGGRGGGGRLQGERQRAAVPQPEQRGQQQRGEARAPPGDGRVVDDGVGRAVAVDLRVLVERRRIAG